MIVTKTPFRITLGGGGTDLPSYYPKHSGFVFSVGINKYMYINVNEPFDDLIRIKYSETEIVDNVDDIKHNIAREALKLRDIHKKLDVVSLADIPAGTGLGSSSCYSVGLLNALHAHQRDYVSLHRLAEEACHLEMNKCNYPVGVQDQFMASYGGLTVLNIQKDGDVWVDSANVSKDVADDLNSNMLMFYTNTTRESNVILSEQNKNISVPHSDIVSNMHRIKDIGYRILDSVECGNITNVGLLFDEHWQCKKRMSSLMSNNRFDEIYYTAKRNGALGGKISGAGGGGFFLFYVEENHKKFINIMKKFQLMPMRYRFEYEGTKVLVNI